MTCNLSQFENDRILLLRYADLPSPCFLCTNSSRVLIGSHAIRLLCCQFAIMIGLYLCSTATWSPRLTSWLSANSTFISCHSSVCIVAGHMKRGLFIRLTEVHMTTISGHWIELAGDSGKWKHKTSWPFSSSLCPASFPINWFRDSEESGTRWKKSFLSCVDDIVEDIPVQV